ncbi:MAG TPA: excinuclease ABC subunit UvrA [Candidatus Babeliales bacterium]|nr:excinuclease ABC subunit UvrA [Candidatus Babeliales bacterium]
MKQSDKKIEQNERKSTEWIIIRGAREHNLKNVDVEIPKNKLTVITGPSGSGKSSLALDVLYTEGKRRYMESLSSYARQFLGIAKKPEFDRIEGLCPAIAIEQKTVGANPRSTVGTITEIADYLRLLFARIGVPHCPNCATEIKPESPDNITNGVIAKFAKNVVTVAAPVAVEKKGEYQQELLSLFERGYYRFVIDGASYKFNSADEIKAIKLAKTYKHSIDVLIDRIEIGENERARLQEAVEKSFSLANGMCKIIVGEKSHLYSSKRMCLNCSEAFPEIEPRFFSFNSPIGACKECNGLGIIHLWPWKEDDPDAWKSKYPDFFGSYAQEQTCRACLGRRLNPYALAVKIGGKNIIEIGELSIKDAVKFFNTISFDETERIIAEGLIKEIRGRLQFLNDVGLSYLSINRSARTLSGGEGQRIRLATQIGSSLSGVLYILDEPSIGLHQRDNDRLINTLKMLRDQGNTVIVVEHDFDTMLQSDYLVDMGPAAGTLGGKITAVGTPEEIKKNPKSLTGAYLSGERAIRVPAKRRNANGYLTLKHATRNNLKDISVSLPLGVMCCVSGVSGSGKSTLILDELVNALQRELASGRKAAGKSEGTTDLEGTEHLESLVVIDQSPIGRTPRSNPATYLGIFDEIRKLFANLPESMARGYKVGRFSFNVQEGRCFECKGDGTITVSMQFLADVVMTCKSCKGQRFNAETLAITYKGKNIAQVLDMTALEAEQFFAAHKNLAKRLSLMCQVGLDYVKLGQPSTTLSGGEAQRIKLVDELAKRGTKTLYILDEPTTGLHTNDIEKLLEVLNRLVDKGNSMIIIEHNLDVLKTADYLLDLGPEGGDEGGTIVAQGTPEAVAKSTKSHTGRYLKPLLKLA